MKKKAIIILIIAGIFTLGLWIRFADDSGEVSAVKTLPWKIMKLLTDQIEETEQKVAQTIQELKSQNEIISPHKINFIEPIVNLNGEKGILEFGWEDNFIRVDADTLLFVIDCYFPEGKLQQKIFFLAEAPNFMLQEVFRQDSRIWEEELNWPESLEWRINRPLLVEGGYVYELDGVLYFLDRDFQEALLLWDLRALMGDYFSSSIGIYHRTCDVTADAARLIACTDKGLYEYDLGNGNQTLLESAYFAPHEINENDCLCGQRDFRFNGPVKVEYGPDEQSYAYLTGTEEADWGDITGIVLCSGEGETLYQKESNNVYDFKWVKSENTIYLAVFYTEYTGLDEKGIVTPSWLMDRVDASTGKVVTFEVPKEIFSGGMMCCIVGFLDADTLFYETDQDMFEVYRLSSGEQQTIEAVGDVDWEIMVLDMYDYGAIPVRYP